MNKIELFSIVNRIINSYEEIEIIDSREHKTHRPNYIFEVRNKFTNKRTELYISNWKDTDIDYIRMEIKADIRKVL